MTELGGSMVWTVARRILFISTLLLTGGISTSITHYVYIPGTPGRPAVGVFAWGMDSISTVLAIWLVARTGIWRSWSGVLRVGTYIIAHAYGRMLFSAVQDWQVERDASFQMPGNKLEDYARPALDLLTLLMDSWLLIPAVILTAMLLNSRDEPSIRSRQFSTSGLIGFTTAAAIALVWMRLLTSELAPETYFSHLSQKDAIKEILLPGLPISIPPLLGAVIMLYGFTKRWWLALIALIAAIAVDFLGTSVVAFVSEYLTGQQKAGILGGTSIDRGLFVCGRSLTCWCAFSTASLMGIHPVFGSQKCERK